MLREAEGLAMESMTHADKTARIEDLDRLIERARAQIATWGAERFILGRELDMESEAKE